MTRRSLQRVVGRRAGRILSQHLDSCLERFGEALPTTSASTTQSDAEATTLPSDDSEDSDDDDDDGKSHHG